MGLGYVGLTLALALARAGVTVIGVESDQGRRLELLQGRVPFREAGLQEALSGMLGKRFWVIDTLPEGLLPNVVLCVGTPLDSETREPSLVDLRAAVESLAPRVDDDTLVIVRSTLPVGMTRTMIVGRFEQTVGAPLVVVCPERTIQGRALEELATLPQVVGGPPQARRRAAELFRRLTPSIVEVSSWEAAELVKLVNNAHTDLIYGFGNEVALIASAIGVAADEVIDAANAGYPRPDLSSPGYVGGSCLVKDPYLLLASARRHGYDPPMVAAARRLNENVPVHVAERVLKELMLRDIDPSDVAVLVSGMAYKGRPETDDVRGGAAPALANVLAPRVGRLLGHDFVVADQVIRGMGFEPVELLQGCSEANVLVVLNNHPRYSDHHRDELTLRLAKPRLVYDVWGVLLAEAASSRADGVYLRLANETPS